VIFAYAVILEISAGLPLRCLSVKNFVFHSGAGT